MESSLGKKEKEEPSKEKSSANKDNKMPDNILKARKRKTLSKTKTFNVGINNSFEKKEKIKSCKTKRKSGIIHKKYAFTSIINSNKNYFNSLIDFEKDNNPINNIDIDNNKQNITFLAKPKIKQKLLKEYNEIKKNELKNRKIKIIANLYDSLDDNEESDDEKEKNGINFYIPLDCTFIIIYDMI